MKDLIKFRTLDIKDAKVLLEIYSDKEAMKYRESKPMISINDAKKYVNNQELKEKNFLTIRKGVELIKTKELIGTVMYKYDKTKKNECTIGYSIGRQFWGQGLGKEIVNNMIKTLEEKKEINKVIAWSNKENIASIKILEKMGFKLLNQEEYPNIYLYNKIINC